MRDEPADLTVELMAEFLQTYWGIRAALSYAPVGHGSYHWIAVEHDGTRWFVTADRLSHDVEHQFATLAAAATTARQLHDHGHEYVVAPWSDRSGSLLRRVRHNWAVQVFPHLSGWSTDQGSWDDPAEQAQVARLVGRLHSANPPDALPSWTFTIPRRDVLESALDNLGQRWTGGPYAEPTRVLLDDAHTEIANLLRRCDELSREIESDADSWVVTHGEPDSDNVIRTDDGNAHLIDWGSVRLAPRERDLVEILNGSTDVVPSYCDTAGPHPPRDDGMDLFRLGWSLVEIGRKVRQFRGRHVESADTAAGWRTLRENIENPGGWFHFPADTPKRTAG